MSTVLDSPNAPAKVRISENDFWQRYSPHHEFPLSTAASVVLHMVVLLAVALFGSFLFNIESPRMTPAIGAVRMGDGEEGGGGKEGREKFTDQRHPVEQVTDVDPFKPEPLPALEAPGQADAPLRPKQEPGRMSNKPQSGGKGGPGAGGGDGPGIGKKTGPGTGIKPSEKAPGRWDIRFRYESGEDYARQLSALGFYLAFPTDDRGGYALYKNYRQRTPRGEPTSTADLMKLGRAFFLNEDPDATGYLAKTLGVSHRPVRFVAFISPELEKDLLAQEQQAASAKGLKVSDLETTLFRVVQEGGRTRVRLESVEAKKQPVSPKGEG